MGVNLGLTINELLEECKKQVKKGNGDKHILISSDDEGNSFHSLFYTFTDKSCSDFDNLLVRADSRHHNKDNCVLLG